MPSLMGVVRRVIAPDILFSFGVGGGLALLLGQGSRTGLLLGAVLARTAYGLLGIEQVVPFSKRRHVILLPITAELTLGAIIFEQFRVKEQLAGKLVKESDRDFKLVRGLADRIIAAVKLGHGGGFQAHVERFNWEVIVVREDTTNAFVMPGGKIVVYTGLISLMNRDKDMLGMVMAHEVAHALARHSNERIGFGLYCMLGAQALSALLSGASSRPLPAPNASAAGGSGHAASRAGLTEREAEEQRVAEAAAAERRQLHVPAWLSQRALSILTTMFLQLPFSRRAEAEADLVGLKLMHLAGYNVDKAPTTFEVLDKAAGAGGAPAEGNGFFNALAAAAVAAKEDEGKPGGHAGAMMSAAVNLGCTHPRGQTRVRLLTQELAAGRAKKDGWEAVHTPANYWSL